MYFMYLHFKRHIRLWSYFISITILLCFFLLFNETAILQIILQPQTTLVFRLVYETTIWQLIYIKKISVHLWKKYFSYKFLAINIKEEFHIRYSSKTTILQSSHTLLTQAAVFSRFYILYIRRFFDNSSPSAGISARPPCLQRTPHEI